MFKDIGLLVFYEKVNIKKLNHIINNPNKYEKIIKEQEKEMRRNNKNYNAYASLQKIRNNIIIPPNLEGTEYGLIKVSYVKGRNSNNIGRWYVKNGVGIQPLVVSVRHTICDGIWVDIDQVNSHPTILKNKLDKYGYISPILNDYLLNREVFLKKIMKEEDCSRDSAKTRVIAVINGCSYKSNTLNKLHNEIKPFIDHINNLPEYKEIKDYVEKTYTDDKNLSGKIISRILQVVENDLLETYLEFFNDKGLITDKNEVALIFDGLQLLKNDKITDELLNECRLYALEKTGYDIELKIKPFDNKLILPENYIDNDDLLNLIDKYNVGLNEFINDNSKLLDEAINEDGSHVSVCNVIKKLLKDVIIYDESAKMWFYCNVNNIWKKSRTSYILNGIISSILSDIFKKYTNILKNKSQEEDDKFKKMSVKSFSIHLKLHNKTYINAICETAQISFNKSKFYEDYIDCNGDLFAFTNKVFDFKTNTTRNIKPTDYIMTNCGYDYPEYEDDEKNKILEEFFKQIYPNEEVMEYVLDILTTMLWGNRTSQSFNIFCGNGSNGKSLLMSVLEKILGEYYMTINAETLTKPKQSSNSTGELHQAKGKRLISMNEPECDKDNKMQVGILKKMAGIGGIETLKERGLYMEAIEFKIHFMLFILCNTKPALSSVDDGIGRRIRVVNHLMKFVDEPDKNNKYQSLKDVNKYKIMITDDIRNAFIRMLLNRWINKVSKIDKIQVPKQINDDSIEYIQSSNEVLGFILENYKITDNDKDRIQSSVLFDDYKRKTNTKMTTSKFKEDILGISGISLKNPKGVKYFTGIKALTADDLDDDE
jgi:P4 family phage/plasmid primase-like protien